MQTRILKVAGGNLGRFREGEGEDEKLAVWEVAPDNDDSSPSIRILRETAAYLRTSDTPVAFPTETVYGLAADATRSAAVRGIYSAKGRPSDNPLIIHVSDLEMLREVLSPAPGASTSTTTTTTDPTNGEAPEAANGNAAGKGKGRIPEIYMPLIRRFWPGPLTILLPNPRPSRLAPEVTAGLGSFGARMPASGLARTLIQLAGVPLAAPSANASTRPSPTAAEHVLEDLRGRIELILDGGPCPVGVESTVVDGLCDPPVVLRPGGVAIDDLRACPGWERVQRAYKDHPETGAKAAAAAAPRAPGMKYKHYSPRARVVLYESSFVAGRDGVRTEDLEAFCADWQAQQQQQQQQVNGTTTTATRVEETLKVGIIRTRHWRPAAGLRCGAFEHRETVNGEAGHHETPAAEVELAVQEAELLLEAAAAADGSPTARLLDLSIGEDTRSIAQGLFSALRELDKRGAHVIFVEGIGDSEDIGAAVMNRLRKAASQIRT